jgi:large subunit ribosomal protein L22
VANAKVLGMDENRLYVSDVRANGGPVFKRFMSRSMGRADRLLKRTTHLSLAVSEGQKIYKDKFQSVAAAEAAEDKSAPKAKKSRAKKAAAGKK